MFPIPSNFDLLCVFKVPVNQQRLRKAAVSVGKCRGFLGSPCASLQIKQTAAQPCDDAPDLERVLSMFLQHRLHVRVHTPDQSSHRLRLLPGHVGSTEVGTRSLHQIGCGLLAAITSSNPFNSIHSNLMARKNEITNSAANHFT